MFKSDHKIADLEKKLAAVTANIERIEKNLAAWCDEQEASHGKFIADYKKHGEKVEASAKQVDKYLETQCEILRVLSEKITK